MDWAGGQYEVTFSKKMLVWGRGTCFENNNTLRERGWVWEIAISQKIQKSAKTKMTLTEFKPTLPLILESSLEVSGKFSDTHLIPEKRTGQSFFYF